MITSSISSEAYHEKKTKQNNKKNDRLNYNGHEPLHLSFMTAKENSLIKS